MSRSLWNTAAFAALLIVAPASQAAGAGYVGVKTCTKCHDVQGESWAETAHAKAFESLKANSKAEEKQKAKLNPAKDYTGDKDCLGCHSTGFGQSGGFAAGGEPGGQKQLGSVGCESCHGAGGNYRDEHSKAEKKLKKDGQATPRKSLVASGQNFDYEKACASCHLNYQGSPHKGGKPPYTPFTPSVDTKYKFEYDQAVRTKALHEHYKLKGAFSGDPVPSVRTEFQQNAKDIPE